MNFFILFFSIVSFIITTVFVVRQIEQQEYILSQEQFGGNCSYIDANGKNRSFPTQYQGSDNFTIKVNSQIKINQNEFIQTMYSTADNTFDNYHEDLKIKAQQQNVMLTARIKNNTGCGFCYYYVVEKLFQLAFSKGINGFKLTHGNQLDYFYFNGKSVNIQLAEAYIENQLFVQFRDQEFRCEGGYITQTLKNFENFINKQNISFSSNFPINNPETYSMKIYAKYPEKQQEILNISSLFSYLKIFDHRVLKSSSLTDIGQQLKDYRSKIEKEMHLLLSIPFHMCLDHLERVEDTKIENLYTCADANKYTSKDFKTKYYSIQDSNLIDCSIRHAAILTKIEFKKIDQKCRVQENCTYIYDYPYSGSSSSTKNTSSEIGFRVDPNIAILTFWHQWAEGPPLIGGIDTPYGREFKLLYNKTQGEYPCRVGYEPNLLYFDYKYIKTK